MVQEVAVLVLYGNCADDLVDAASSRRRALSRIDNQLGRVRFGLVYDRLSYLSNIGR